MPVLILEPKDGQVTQNGHARGVARNEHHRLLSVGGRRGVGLSHDDEDFAPVVRHAGDPPLAAIDHVLVAVPYDRCLDVRGVRGREVPPESWRHRQ